ncbi:MAG: ABC transporter [Wenzhouxiangella sp.]|nr:MAG: ABC transporter [Wenzhouxiangella sp.]
MMIFDPLFRVPFFNGLVLAAVLALVGAYLRMRDEWLATFALAQVAAAGGVLGLPLGLPIVLTAGLAAGLLALVYGLLPRVNNNHYGVAIVLGWAAAILLAANTHQGSVIIDSLLRGQLYFSGPGHLLAAMVLALLLLTLLPWLSRRLMLGRFFPDHFSANRQPAWPHRVGFGLLVVFSVVLGTVALGAVSAFALFFIPSWVAFVLARGWRRSLVLSVVLAVAAYLVAFALAIELDQPFGPVLVLVLVALVPLRLFARSH